MIFIKNPIIDLKFDFLIALVSIYLKLIFFIPMGSGFHPTRLPASCLFSCTVPSVCTFFCFAFVSLYLFWVLFRVSDVVRDAALKHGVLFFGSAMNAGPALTTVQAPGGSTQGMIGVGAYA